MEIRIRRAQPPLVSRDHESRPAAGLVAIPCVQHRRTRDHGERTLAGKGRPGASLLQISSSTRSAISSRRNDTGEHGIVLVFDSMGSLIAHPDFAQLVGEAMPTHPSPANNCQTSRRSTPGSWRQPCERRAVATAIKEASATNRGGTICSG